MKSPSKQLGFTLMELVVSMFVTSILVVALGSSMLIAGKAMPGADTPEASLLEASGNAFPLAQELQYATEVTLVTPHEITFTVADRDDDEVPESIHYQWSGTPGDPLTRQMNSNSQVTLIAEVEDFTLNYLYQTKSTTITSSEESESSTLVSYSGYNVLTPIYISDNLWYGQYAKPYLSENAQSWSLTAIDFVAKAGIYNYGEFTIQIQKATQGGYPTGVVLAERTLQESSLSSSYYQWYRVYFSGVTELNPDQGICILFIWGSGSSEACILQIDKQDTSESSNRHAFKSSDDGVTWTIQSKSSTRFYVRGTENTPGDSSVITSQFVQSVDIVLKTHEQDSATLNTRVQLVNLPEVTE